MSELKETRDFLLKGIATAIDDSLEKVTPSLKAFLISFLLFEWTSFHNCSLGFSRSIKKMNINPINVMPVDMPVVQTYWSSLNKLTQKQSSQFIQKDQIYSNQING